MTDTLYNFTMVVNALWLGSAFWYFSFKNSAAAKLFIPKSARSSPIFPTMSAAIRFLGGMNFALALLAIMVLTLSAIDEQFFAHAFERAVLLLGFGAAHATQLLFNVPIAMRGGRIGESYWPVLSGPMLFIFVTDAITASLNFLCAALFLFT